MSESHLNLPWSRVPGWVADVLADGSIVGASPLFYKMMGWGPSTRTWLQRMAPEARERLLLKLTQPEDFQLPLTWHTRDVATRRMICTGWWRQEEQRHTCVLSHEVEEQGAHRTERGQQQTEQHHHAFMQVSTDGVLFHTDGIITSANPAACALFGLPIEALMGRQVLDFLVQAQRAQARLLMAQAEHPPTPATLVTAQGEHITLEVSSRTLQRNGAPTMRMVVLRDTRDRRKAEARIQELIDGLRAEKNRAEAADRGKSVFLAAASHDLRQPIHALGLLLTALRVMAQGHNLSADMLIDICRRMQSSLDGLGELLNMLLDVSRLDANAVQVVRAPIHLDTLLDELGQAFRPLALEKKLRLRVAPSALWVDTDPTVLRRILGNLLSNAVRYTSSGGVLLGCRRRGAQVEIQVWDSGIGIPDEQRARIFEAFYQIGQSKAQHHEAHGLGLGLSIVQRSAQLLDAQLQLCSRPERGSVFSIRLPRCEARLLEDPPEPLLSPAARGLGVLVIDDDVQVLGAMQQVLTAWGHRPFCATSASDAVVIAASHPDQIDLLLSDHRLSGSISAYDTIRTVQACLLRSVPTYVLTGDTSPQRILEATRLGFPVLHKPVPAAVLHGILEAQAPSPPSLA